MFSINFLHKNLIDDVNYSFAIRSIEEVGSCNTVVGAGSNQTALKNSLFINGTGNFGTYVPSGSCRTFSAIITDLSSNEIISSSMLYVDNV